MQTLNLNQNIFREYDIRGDAAQDLPTDLVRMLGAAFGSELYASGARRITLGRDCRLSSPRLHDAMLEGLQSTGIDVLDIGVVPTPLLYFSAFHFDADGAVQITGSHNPAGENGFKLMMGKDSFFGEAIQRLKQRILTGDIDKRERGRYETVDVIQPYVNYVKDNIKLGPHPVSCAIDAGSGAGGPASLAVYQALGLKPIALLCEMDGNFPTHHPDPTQPENLVLLRQTVADHALRLGIAYDGDADRLGVIDEKGNVLWGDQLMVLYSRAILKEMPGAAIIAEVKCSQVLFDEIKRLGGNPIMWKTGHSLIKTKMKEEKALLAGEMSGHLFFKHRYFGYDDAIYASLRLVEILSHTPQALSEMLADLPRTFTTPEMRVACSDEKKFELVKRVVDHFSGKYPVITVDGARIQFAEGWGLVRASNTQPVLVLRFEANSEALLASYRNEVEETIQKFS